MALQGTFEVDFAKFETAVAQADVSLKSFQDNGTNAAASLTRIENSLTGVKIVQQATIAAQAVANLGEAGGITAGLLQLTDAELQRVGASAVEASAKLKAMGQEVPPGIQQIADATKAANKETVDWMGGLQSLAGSLGVVFSVGAVVNFGKAVMETGAQIVEMSDRMHISTDAVQGFKFAAEQSGTTLDAVAGAMDKLNKNLDAGSKATVATLKDLGLNFQTIYNMKPEDRFLAITDAIQGMQDPTKQTADAIKLLGRGAGELTPAIIAGFRTVSDSAAKMSSDTAHDLKDAEESWRKFGAAVTVFSAKVLDDTGHALAGMASGVNQARSSSAAFAMFADNVIKYGVGPALQMSAALDQTATSGKNAKDVILSLPAPIKKTAEEIAAEEAAAKKLADTIASLSQTQGLKELDAAVAALGGVQKLTTVEFDRASAAAAKLRDEGAKLTPQLQLLASVHDMASKVIAQNTATINDNEKAWERDSVAIGKAILLASQTQAVFQAPGAGNYFLNSKNLQLPPIDVSAVNASLKPVLDQLNQATFNDIEGRMRAFGVLTQSVLQQSATYWTKTYDDMAASGKFTAAELEAAWKHMVDANVAAGKGMELQFEDDMLGIGTAMLTAFSSGGSVAQAAQSGAVKMGSDLSKSLLSGTVTSLSKDSPLLGKALGDLAGPLGGAAVTLGINLGEKLWNSVFGKPARDAVTAFANANGGFPLIQQRLEALGAAGQQMWVNLTQVGSKDVAGAAAAIKAVTDALAAQSAAANTSISNLTTKISALGGAIDPALDPYIQKLEQAGTITAANATALQALEGTGTPTYDQLNALAQKYNLTIGQMGPAFQASQIDAGFQTLIDDMDEMSRGGVDMNAVLTQVGADGTAALSGLGTQVQTLIDQSQQYGVQVPANMKPAAQALIDQGLLLDANGQKITDINQINFGETMQTSLDTLNQTLQTLIGTLTGNGPTSLLGSLNTIGGVVVNPKIQPVYDDSQIPAGFTPPATAPATVSPAGSGIYTPSPATSGGTPINITVQSNLDGKVVAQNQVQYIPGALSAGGR